MTTKKTKGLPNDFDEMMFRTKLLWIDEHYGCDPDDLGFNKGIREDAPNDVKEAYSKLKKIDDDLMKKGIILD